MRSCLSEYTNTSYLKKALVKSEFLHLWTRLGPLDFVIDLEN